VREQASEGGHSEGPTVLRIQLGAHLRRLREDRGLSRQEAGEAIRCSDSKISRIELGRVGIKERDLADLLTFYAVIDPAERDRLLAQARQAKAPGWWRAYTDVTPDWFHNYLGLESAARLIRTYEIQFVPGLLQTEQYARAVVLLAHENASTEEIDRRVRLRMNRQQLLTQPDPPVLGAVIDEAALRRPVGGPAVMRGQIQALIDVTKHPNVRLQVIPLSAGGHAAAGGSFSILRFPHDLPDIVYVEHLTVATYLDKRDDVDKYAEIMNRLAVEAKPPDQTVAILTDNLARFTNLPA
jgi:transcriptional regulator with XRE-family HTH domain